MAKVQPASGAVSARTRSWRAVNYGPLYKQVKRTLVERIAGGKWRQGDLIPSEHELAAELKVSQGTVRKALDEMTADNLLVRVQGRGTFVSRFDDEKLLFHFFRVVPDDGARTFPDSRVIMLDAAEADDEAAMQLGIRVGTPIWQLVRCRSLSDAPAIAESITLPLKLFPDLLSDVEIPNNIYGLFAERYRVTIARAEERVKAVGASRDVAKVLGCKAGEPVLQVSRRAYDVAERIVEWRVSTILTHDVHYGLEIK